MLIMTIFLTFVAFYTLNRFRLIQMLLSPSSNEFKPVLGCNW